MEKNKVTFDECKIKATAPPPPKVTNVINVSVKAIHYLNMNGIFSFGGT